MNYTINYFIRKFEAIPDNRWCTGAFYNKDTNSYCALGHCGGTTEKAYTVEGSELDYLFKEYGYPSIASVNDDLTEFGTTPKERILTVLNYIKSGIHYDQI